MRWSDRGCIGDSRSCHSEQDFPHRLSESIEVHMQIAKAHSVESVNDTSLHATTQFVEDFTRVVKDVDRLMTDIRSVAERETTFGHENGSRTKNGANLSVLTLQQHARSFLQSLSSLARFPDHIPLPYLEFDTDGQILRSNNECVRMLNGGTPVIGRSVFDFLARADIKRFRDHLAAVRQTDKPQHVQLSIFNKRRFLPLELWTRRQLVGGQMSYVGVIEPSEESRHASNSLSSSREGTLASLHALVVSLNNAHTLKSVADAFGDHCRQQFNSPAGMVFIERDGDLQLISHWHSARFSKKSLDPEMIRNGPVARAFRSRGPVLWGRDRTASSKISRHLGQLLDRSRCSSIVFLPISSPPKRPVGVLAMFVSCVDKAAPLVLDALRELARTVTGSVVRARAYDEALAARTTAERAVVRQEEFLSVLSHELKNPMMPILGWAIALGSGTLPAEKQNVAVDGIVRNVRSLNYLIDDLFDVARISAGKLRLARTQMRIQEVAREALSSVQSVAEKKKLRISTDISEGIPPFRADPARLRQVLVNLLNNAVKFTTEGGMIALKIFKRGNSVEFTVTDTGKGIAPKFLPLVFDRFRQDYRSSKPKETGLGLGLAIVREIIGLHGGSIRAYSEGVDKGATFRVRIPMHTKHGQAVHS
jgi:signal transduction histidine kinase